MANESENDVTKALAAFGAAPIKYRTFAHVAPRPAALAQQPVVSSAVELPARPLPTAPDLAEAATEAAPHEPTVPAMRPVAPHSTLVPPPARPTRPVTLDPISPVPQPPPQIGAPRLPVAPVGPGLAPVVPVRVQPPVLRSQVPPAPLPRQVGVPAALSPTMPRPVAPLPQPVGATMAAPPPRPPATGVEKVPTATKPVPALVDPAPVPPVMPPAMPPAAPPAPMLPQPAVPAMASVSAPRPVTLPPPAEIVVRAIAPAQPVVVAPVVVPAVVTGTAFTGVVAPLPAETQRPGEHQAGPVPASARGRPLVDVFRILLQGAGDDGVVQPFPAS